MDTYCNKHNTFSVIVEDIINIQKRGEKCKYRDKKWWNMTFSGRVDGYHGNY